MLVRRVPDGSVAVLQISEEVTNLDSFVFEFVLCGVVGPKTPVGSHHAVIVNQVTGTGKLLLDGLNRSLQETTQLHKPFNSWRPAADWAGLDAMVWQFVLN